MRRWFGVMVLGFVVFVVGAVGWRIMYMAELETSWPVALADLVLMLAAVGGLVAVVVGLVGVGVSAVRRPSP